MNDNCVSCKDIISFEQELDRRAYGLVDRVNSECADSRKRNKERWEEFAKWTRLPVVGNIIFELYRAPADLERDPQYYYSEWYRSERSVIEKQARILETMKAEHMEHWGSELVEAAFPWDYAGYYADCHPPNPMERNLAYEIYAVEGRKENLRIFVPDKYDFTSAAGAGKMQEGIFVLDAGTKEVVPLNQCDCSWRDLGGRASNIFEKIAARLARTGSVYNLRR